MNTLGTVLIVYGLVAEVAGIFVLWRGVRADKARGRKPIDQVINVGAAREYSSATGVLTVGGDAPTTEERLERLEEEALVARRRLEEGGAERKRLRDEIEDTDRRSQGYADRRVERHEAETNQYVLAGIAARTWAIGLFAAGVVLQGVGTLLITVSNIK